MENVPNRLIKKITALLTKKGRDEYGQFIIEGEKFVEEITPDWHVECCVVSEAYAKSHPLEVYAGRWRVYVATDAVFNKLSDTVTPQGILAVCEKKKFALSDVDLTKGFIVFGECVSDPGNAGTLLRTADAAGAGLFVLSKGSVDIYSPKIMRSCAGSVFHLPVITDADTEQLVRLCKDGSVRIVAAVTDGEWLPYDVDMRGRCCILIGNEARGLSTELKESADYRVRLPMPGKAESLNAGVAGGILMYEAVRQRMTK